MAIFFAANNIEEQKCCPQVLFGGRTGVSAKLSFFRFHHRLQMSDNGYDDQETCQKHIGLVFKGLPTTP